MGLWRDPLDELIDDLDRALPAEPEPGEYELLPRLEDLQFVTASLLYGSEQERVGMQSDPLYHKSDSPVAERLNPKPTE